MAEMTFGATLRRTAILALAEAAMLACAVADEGLPRASAERLERRIIELGRFGANPEGGVSRVAFGDADIAGREYVKSLMRGAGLEVRVNSMGDGEDRERWREAVREQLSFTPMHRDEILREVGALPGLVADALLELVLSGEAEEHSGGRFSLKAD